MLDSLCAPVGSHYLSSLCPVPQEADLYKTVSASVFVYWLPIRFLTRNTGTKWQGRKKKPQACCWAVAAFLYQNSVRQLLPRGYHSLHPTAKAPSPYPSGCGYHFLQLLILGCFTKLVNSLDPNYISLNNPFRKLPSVTHLTCHLTGN